MKANPGKLTLLSHNLLFMHYCYHCIIIHSTLAKAQLLLEPVVKANPGKLTLLSHSFIAYSIILLLPFYAILLHTQYSTHAHIISSLFLLHTHIYYRLSLV